MGATPVPVGDIARFAREFEDAGWDGLSVGEAHGLIPDPYTVLGAAAAATTTLKVGTSVAVPLRHPLLAASAMSTLHGVSRGRASFSIGRGDGAVKVLQRSRCRSASSRRTPGARAGLPPARGGRVRRPVVLGLARVRRRSGPRPAEAADRRRGHRAEDDRGRGEGRRRGQLLGRRRPGRLQNSIRLAQETCRALGRDFDELSVGCYVQVAVTDEEDREAREAIRGLVVTHARFSGFEPKSAREDVSTEEHEKFRHAVETMETVYRSARGGVALREGGRPSEVDFYPLGPAPTS